MSIEKCRTCYTELPENSIRLDTIDFIHSISIGTKLSQCIPELEFNATKEKICKSCVNLVTTFYNFRKMCLQTEAVLKSKDFDANAVTIKSEPAEVFVPMNIVKTEMNSEEHVVHDLTEDENVSRSNNSSEMHTCSGDVITGDISVGFEITNAKQIHNTVSVSFTTNSEKSCRFQAEKCSDLETSVQSVSKKLNNASGTVGAQSCLTFDTTNLQQCNSGLSDLEIVDNFLKKRPTLQRKNITNARVALSKLPKSVVLSLFNANRTVYTCKFCDSVIINRRRLRNHNAKHLRLFQVAEVDNLRKSKIQNKRHQLSQLRSPRQQKKIRPEFREAEENEMPILEPISQDIPLQLHSSSPLLLPVDVIDADYKKSERNSFDIKKSTNKADVKMRGSNWVMEPFKVTNLKPSTKNTRPKPKRKSTVNKQQLCRPIKTEVLEPSETVMKCDFCNITFCSSNMFNLHMSLHPNENKPIMNPNQHVCEVCKASFNAKNQLYGHMAVHSSKRSAKRNAGQSKAITGNSKKATESKEKPSKKSHSNKEIDETLNENINLKNNKTNNLSLGRNLKNIECKMCNRKYNTVYHYNVHLCLKTDETQKIFKCEVCQDHFFGRNAFLEHVKSHLNGFT